MPCAFGVRFVWVLLPLMVGGCYLSHTREVDRARDAGPIFVEPDAQIIEVDAGVPSCRLASFGEVQVSRAPTHSSQAPDLVWNGDGVSVAMMEGGGDFGHPIVTMANVSADLARVTEPTLVGEEAHGWGELASSGGALALCWSGDPGGPMVRTMYRQLFDGGSRLGSRVVHDPDGEACLDLAFARDRVLVAWRRRVPPTTGAEIATMVQVLMLDGTPAGEEIELARAAYPGRNASLAAHAGSFFAALSPSTGTARVLELSASGAIVGQADVPIGDARGVVLAAARGELALVIASGPEEVRSLWLVVLDRALAPRTAPRRITDGAPSALQAAIAPLPDGWLVAWTDEHQPSTSMTLLHVGEDGAAREPRIVAHRGDNSAYGGPAIAMDGARAFVALSHEIDGREPEQTFVQGWRCDPGTRDVCARDDVLPGACGVSEPVGWYWDGSDCEPLICPSVCGGSDCDRLAPSRFACLADRAECAPPPVCEPLDFVDRACMDSRIVGERAFNVIRIDRTVDCACASELHCSVRVDAPFQITLETSECLREAACDCDRGLVSTECYLPALSAGTWSVQPPGLAPFPIEVRAPWEMTEIVPLCTDWE